jgi:hypothetical protein
MHFPYPRSSKAEGQFVLFITITSDFVRKFALRPRGPHITDTTLKNHKLEERDTVTWYGRKVERKKKKDSQISVLRKYTDADKHRDHGEPVFDTPHLHASTIALSNPVCFERMKKYVERHQGVQIA